MVWITRLPHAPPAPAGTTKDGEGPKSTTTAATIQSRSQGTYKVLPTVRTARPARFEDSRTSYLTCLNPRAQVLLLTFLSVATVALLAFVAKSLASNPSVSTLTVFMAWVGIELVTWRSVGWCTPL